LAPLLHRAQALTRLGFLRFSPVPGQAYKKRAGRRAQDKKKRAQGAGQSLPACLPACLHSSQGKF